MDSYTIITSGGRKTNVTGYLSQIIESQKGRKTGVGIWIGSLLICTIDGGVVTWFIG